MFQRLNPNKTYPDNIGAKWTEEEDKTLIEEIADNIDFDIIANNHKRTIGGINARRREIAYRLHLEYDSMEEIIKKTRLPKEEITATIERKTNYAERKQERYESKINKKETNIRETNIREIIDISEIKSELTTMRSEVVSMRSEIFELKKTVNELAEMLKLVYEFETE
jgi:hypothetical protein